MMIDPEDLVDSTEAAALLGLSLRQAISTYRGRYGADHEHPFPTPVVEKSRCVLWRRQDIEAWARATGRLP